MLSQPFKFDFMTVFNPRKFGGMLCRFTGAKAGGLFTDTYILFAIHVDGMGWDPLVEEGRDTHEFLDFTDKQSRSVSKE